MEWKCAQSFIQIHDLRPAQSGAARGKGEPSGFLVQRKYE